MHIDQRFTQFDSGAEAGVSAGFVIKKLDQVGRLQFLQVFASLCDTGTKDFGAIKRFFFPGLSNNTLSMH